MKLYKPTLTILFLFLTCVAAYGSAESQVRVALALSLSLQEDQETGGKVAGGILCPCSANGGLCPCTELQDCGCVRGEQCRWIETTKPEQVALYHGKQQIGNWWYDEQVYKRMVELPYGGYTWQQEQCPVKPPVRKVAYTQPVTRTIVQLPYGTDPNQVGMLPYTSYSNYSAPVMRVNPAPVRFTTRRPSFSQGNCGPGG